MPEYAHIHPDTPLMVVVDTSVLLHKLHQSIPHEHNDEQFEGIIKANLVWLMSGAWLGHELRHKMRSMVFVKDVKPYWRSEWLADITNTIDLPHKTKAKQALAVQAREILNIPVEKMTESQLDTHTQAQDKLTVSYKAGRKLPEYSFKKIRKLVYKYLDQLNVRVLDKVGYEADDMAASIVQTNTDNGSPWDILLLTVDTDWLGLVNPNVTWCCMTGFNPVIRDSIEVCNSWVEPKLKCSLKTWREIWDVKGEKGDTSDNLPRSKGLLLPVIDLLNPPMEHRYWLRAQERINKLFVPELPAFTLTQAKEAKRHLVLNGLTPVNKMLPGERLEPLEMRVFPIVDVNPMLQLLSTVSQVPQGVF